MSIRSLLKKPAYLILTFTSYLNDVIRYTLNGSVIRFDDSERKLAALIRKDNHRLEKGMALPEPRLWFGEPVLARLFSNLRKYNKFDESRSEVLDESNAVIQEYVEKFQRNQPAPSKVARHLAELTKLFGRCQAFEAGTKQISGRLPVNERPFDFEQFVYSRHSIRQFSGETVSTNTIESAVQLAIRTPSVCNRCAWKVLNIATPTLRKRVLSCQNGNAGFGDLCGNVLIVTMDLRCFEGGGERNQAFVDGGLFAMNLVNALHSKGVATCFLNWSADFLQDRKLRRVADIPSHDVVVTLIGIGGYPNSLNVAISPRPEVRDVLVNA